MEAPPVAGLPVISTEAGAGASTASKTPVQQPPAQQQQHKVQLLGRRLAAKPGQSAPAQPPDAAPAGASHLAGPAQAGVQRMVPGKSAHPPRKKTLASKTVVSVGAKVTPPPAAPALDAETLKRMAADAVGHAIAASGMSLNEQQRAAIGQDARTELNRLTQEHAQFKSKAQTSAMSPQELVAWIENMQRQVVLARRQLEEESQRKREEGARSQQSRIDNLQQRIDQLKAERGEAPDITRDELAALNEKLKAHQERVTLLEWEADSKQQDLAEAQKELADQKQARDALQAQDEGYKRQREALLKQVADSQQKLTAAQQEKTQKQAEAARRIAADASEGLEALASAKAEAARYKQTCDELQGKSEQQTNQIADLQGELSASQQKIGTLETEVRQKTESVQADKGQVREFEKRVKQLERQLKQAQSALRRRGS